MTVYYELSDLKLKPVPLTTTASDTESWHSGEGNEVQFALWRKLTNNPEAWECSFVSRTECSVSGSVKYRLLPDYAPISQQQKKKRSTGVWLASISVTELDVTQTLADGYYFFNLKRAQGYCETAALMICEQLGIPFPSAGASILVDCDGHPITRHCRVVLPSGTEVVVLNFGWHEFYLPSTSLKFKHSPLGDMQVRPTVKYIDANHNWKSVPCCEVSVVDQDNL